VVAAIMPINAQVHDTYWVVAHLHYVLFGGSTFGIMAGLYYWFPKMSGRRYSEGLARVHFWLMFSGFNLTFFPMHLLGMLGMQRRIASYPVETGFLPLNVLATSGAFLLGFSVLVMLINFRRSLRFGAAAGPDPWRANTLEWLPTSPPPAYNFRDLPTVESERPLRDLRFGAAATGLGRPISRATGATISAEAHDTP
jgi:cytochrome c oxidase subunit 1